MRVLERWKLERDNSELELVQMQKLKSEITTSFQERIQLRRMLVEIEDKNMQNKSEIDWREAQISAFEKCRSPRPHTGPEAGQENPKEGEPSTIRNLRREVEVYNSNSVENESLKVELMSRLKELSIEGQQRWANLGQYVTKAERRELLELVVQTHTLELQNMELELQLRLKDKMINDLQREMEQMRQTMRRHGIVDDEFGTDGTEAGALSARSSTVDGSSVDVGEVEEELPLIEPLPTVEEHPGRSSGEAEPLSIAGLSILA